mmetsp:Transcript_23041/g.71219  ORF Transcript_23041/g.71219 Transcript_23041/m.71219 type:complete len:246 (+) Transcript_23041:554-1291(+)
MASARRPGWCPRLANAHMVLERFWGLKSLNFHMASSCTASSSLSPGKWCSVASAHSRLETFCGLKSAILAYACSATAISTASPGCRCSVAYAHTVLTRFCGLYASNLRRASTAMASTSCCCGCVKRAKRESLASAQTELASSCGLKERMRLSDSTDIRSSRSPGWYDSDAIPHMMLASDCVLNSSRCDSIECISRSKAHARCWPCGPMIISSSVKSPSCFESLAKRCSAVLELMCEKSITRWSMR